jgi:hypothetical protein
VKASPSFPKPFSRHPLQVVQQEVDLLLAQLQRAQPATLVKLAGLGAGLTLLLWDWHWAVGLGGIGVGLKLWMRLSPAVRLQWWRQVQRLYRTQPALLLFPAGVCTALLLGETAQFPLGVGLGLALGVALKSLSVEGEPSPQAVLTQNDPADFDGTRWVKALSAPESLHRLGAIQQLHTWMQSAAQPQLAAQDRFIVRALQLCLKQETEPLVQQALVEALQQCSKALGTRDLNLVREENPPNTLNQTTPVPQLAPGSLPLMVRRPPAYQTQASLYEEAQA